MLNLLHFNFFINFVCVTSRLIDVVCMCVSNKVVKRKTYECLIFLPFGKMLLRKKHVADNFLLQFQDEDKRFVNIYYFERSRNLDRSFRNIYIIPSFPTWEQHAHSVQNARSRFTKLNQSYSC